MFVKSSVSGCCLAFCQFKTGLAYKVAYKKSASKKKSVSISVKTRLERLPLGKLFALCTNSFSFLMHKLQLQPCEFNEHRSEIELNKTKTKKLK